ncbi:MAG: anti-sigma factor [Gemmatimonadetes bacterium]|nr:anti-sigma factor [Gemmatimonadota bacterium]
MNAAGVGRPSTGGLGRIVAVTLTAFALVTCGESGTGPPVLETTDLVVSYQNLVALDGDEYQAYEAWVIDSDDVIRSAGRFQAEGTGAGSVTLQSPVRNPTDVFITVEPAGDQDDQPSMLKVMGGRVQGGTATFDINRYVTSGVPMTEEPGSHVLFTPSDNAALFEGSNEDAGVWLFNIFPDSGGANFENRHFFLDFTPLTRGWIYEGWMVYEMGTANEAWFSYGKFEPDEFKDARFRDSSGLGPFSGFVEPEYVFALPLEIQFPGDDWVGNPNGYPVPGDLPLPLDLNGCNPDVHSDCAPEYVGPSRFTHVITVEPYEDRDNDDAWAAEPFFIRPYRNPVGIGAADEPRPIGFFPDELPGGSARIGG